MGMMFTAAILVAIALPPGSGSRVEAERDPRPTRATEATRADADALAALEKPGEVFFREDFEAKDALAKFFDADSRRDGILLLARNASLAHTGAGVLRCTTVEKKGASSHAGVNYWFGKPRRKDNVHVEPGYERVYFRYYVKWADGYEAGPFDHAGATLAAVASGNMWEGLSSAGKRPTGRDYCTVRFQASTDRRRHQSPGAMACFATWMEMEPERDGKYWGNLLWPEDDQRFLPEPGVWYCMEQMVQLNSFKDGVPQADGELATWINGTLYAHFTGIQWRESPKVRLKRIGVGIYAYKPETENTVWFDDLALSTGYIGPLPDSKAEPAPAIAPGSDVPGSDVPASDAAGGGPTEAK